MVPIRQGRVMRIFALAVFACNAVNCNDGITTCRPTTSSLGFLHPQHHDCIRPAFPSRQRTSVMALAPQFATHRIAGRASAAHVLEVYLDIICPYSRTQLQGIRQHVLPFAEANPEALTVIIRQVSRAAVSKVSQRADASSESGAHPLVARRSRKRGIPQPPSSTRPRSASHAP